MTSRLPTLLLCCTVLLAAAPLPAQTGFVAEYPPVQDSEAALRREIAMSSRLLENLADEFNRSLRMPRRVALRMVECPSSDIRWNAEERALELCYRMAVRLEGLAERHEGLEDQIPGAYFYLMAHGLAHALVDELDLPVGRDPEVRAHEVTALLVALMRREESVLWVLRGISAFQRGDPGWGDWAHATQHRLGPEQVRELACMVYGMQPESFGGLRQAGFVAAGARERCQAAAMRISETPGRQLLRYLTTHSR
jgi:Putative metallopeptidase